MAEAKPYDIPKQLVWEAYKKVKANRGAAGVDGETLGDFEMAGRVDANGTLTEITPALSTPGFVPVKGSVLIRRP